MKNVTEGNGDNNLVVILGDGNQNGVLGQIFLWSLELSYTIQHLHFT